ncbi:MAG TPA: metallophosphoesterase family protein [Candidatus Dormibacteraeota bacterium]|jgi:predicted phosphodiesterase|nr:metallophosphoesterase family protein [Candidatus Dormibacteraeota bacterium]
MLLVVRVAVLADIHGNLAALDAALEAVDNLHPDRLIVAGDVVDGAPDSEGCWQRVKGLGVPVLRGNHERYLFDFDTERADPEWSVPRFGPLRASREEVGPETVAELADLPTSWRDAGVPGLLVVHASLRSDADSVQPYTPDGDIGAMFPGDEVPELILRGHNHICMSRQWGGRRIVTVGSVGLALDGHPSAQFTVAELSGSSWQVRHHAVAYDVEATLRRFRETCYLDRAGPMGRLVIREVATGSSHLIPFLRDWRRSEDPSLERAVSTFLTQW